MEKGNWARTILIVYNYLERVTGAIDKIVKQRAVNSFYYNSTSCGYNDVQNVTKDILSLTERKINLINLKVICEDALSKIKTEYAKLLIFTFIEKKKTTEVAQMLKISQRSYFRKLDLALQAFYKELVNMGYDENRLNDLYSKEGWILEVKDKTKDKEKQTNTVTFTNIYDFNHQFHSSLPF